MRLLGPLLALCLTQLLAASVQAEAPPSSLIELSFVPADRAQIAVWVERSDGRFLGTLALTYAVANAGIGNRPGALQMNSGYRWPYGRREGVLPVWAHRRASAPGAKQFTRVIFQDRKSEGFASRTSNDNSVDDYYCLSFDRTTTGRDALDAVTCASVFASDKGRFITKADVAAGYAEPYESPAGQASMRPLGLTSLYPPRRNAQRCSGSACLDHPDLTNFREHAVEVMPELDAVSRATPGGGRNVRWVWPVPREWDLDADYVLVVEVNVEGDYNREFNDEIFPTPSEPAGRWDTWAETFGYPYRGQPSVVYELPFRIDAASTKTVRRPSGYGALHGEDGEVHAMSQAISDDPGSSPGSGADRLRLIGGTRARLSVTLGDPCELANPPAECGMPCTQEDQVCGELVCADDNTCQSECVALAPPSPPTDLVVSHHKRRQLAHTWATLSFRVPASDRPIAAYDVRIRTRGGPWDQAYTHDATEELLPVALDLCTDPKHPMGENPCPTWAPGQEITADLTGLQPSTEYEVSVAARDSKCNATGEAATARFSTQSREFTTVSPCFVATAAYGTPLAPQVGVLRAFRDRYLAPHAPGRALIRAYYAFGPRLAATLRAHPWLRAAAQVALAPVVHFARWWLP